MKRTSFLLILILAFFLAHFVQPYANSGVSKAIMMLLMAIGFIWPIVFIVSIYRIIKNKKKRLVTKRRIGVAIFLALTFPLALLSFIPPEGIFLFNPDIDTQYTSGYTEAKFKKITQGMTKENVISILGDPFSIINVAEQKDFNELWLYTNDGACSWSDFAWKRKQVFLKNDIVVKANTGWAYD